MRRILAPYPGICPADSPTDFERALLSAGDLGMMSFEADQVIWYTEARSGAASCRGAVEVGEGDLDEGRVGKTVLITGSRQWLQLVGT